MKSRTQDPNKASLEPIYPQAGDGAEPSMTEEQYRELRARIDQHYCTMSDDQCERAAEDLETRADAIRNYVFERNCKSSPVRLCAPRTDEFLPGAGSVSHYYNKALRHANEKYGWKYGQMEKVLLRLWSIAEGRDRRFVLAVPIDKLILPRRRMRQN